MYPAIAALYGGGVRDVPIFRELRPYLLAVCEQHAVKEGIGEGIGDTSPKQKPVDQVGAFGAKNGATGEKTERASDKGKIETPKNTALETIQSKEKQDKKVFFVPSGRPNLNPRTVLWFPYLAEYTAYRR